MLVQEITGHEFVYSRQQEIKNFHPKVDNCMKLWVKVFIVTFLDAPATVDILTASSKSL